jgi:hypothetical protein
MIEIQTDVLRLRQRRSMTTFSIQRPRSSIEIQLGDKSRL